MPLFSLSLSFCLLLHFAKHHKQSNSTNNILRPFLNCFTLEGAMDAMSVYWCKKGVFLQLWVWTLVESDLNYSVWWDSFFFAAFLSVRERNIRETFFLHKNNNTKSTVLIVVLFVNAIVIVQKYIWFSVFDSFEGNECFCLLIYSFV